MREGSNNESSDFVRTVIDLVKSLQFQKTWRASYFLNSKNPNRSSSVNSKSMIRNQRHVLYGGWYMNSFRDLSGRMTIFGKESMNVTLCEWYTW
jgi:hypothetical protein